MSQKFQLIVSFAQTQQRLRALMHPIHMPKGIGSFHAESQTYLKGIVRKASCCQIRRSSHRPQGLQVVASATAPSKGRSPSASRVQEGTSETSPRQPQAEPSQPTARQIQVCDKVIAVFQARPSSDWRRLIAFSKQWPELSASLFARLQNRLDAATDQKERSDLRKLNRKLKEVHEELQVHNKVLQRYLDTPETEWERLVASGRGSLSSSFFAHMENLIRANHDDIPKRDEMARVATRLLMLVDALDKVVENENAMEVAGQDFKNLLDSVQSVQDADAKIEQLAKTGKLNPALMLTMANAYAAAKDTDYTKEQVKDVMAHLYFKAKESFAAQQPPALRILKHLLWIESPSDRKEAMDQAFSPGPELTTSTQDYLSTTPQELSKLMEAILATYDASVAQTQTRSMSPQTQGIMNPQVIENMRKLLSEVRKLYL